MKHGDIISIEWFVMLDEKVLQSCNTEAEATQIADRRGGTVKKVEWKYGGRTK